MTHPSPGEALDYDAPPAISEGPRVLWAPPLVGDPGASGPGGLDYATDPAGEGPRVRWAPPLAGEPGAPEPDGVDSSGPALDATGTANLFADELTLEEAEMVFAAQRRAPPVATAKPPSRAHIGGSDMDRLMQSLSEEAGVSAAEWRSWRDSTSEGEPPFTLDDALGELDEPPTAAEAEVEAEADEAGADDEIQVRLDRVTLTAESTEETVIEIKEAVERVESATSRLERDADLASAQSARLEAALIESNARLAAIHDIVARMGDVLIEVSRRTKTFGTALGGLSRRMDAVEATLGAGIPPREKPRFYPDYAGDLRFAAELRAAQPIRSPSEPATGELDPAAKRIEDTL